MADHFESYVRRSLELEELRQLSLAVQRAVEPFNPGDIWIGLEEMGGKKYIHTSCTNWPSMETVIDISRLDTVRYPEDAYMAIMRLVAEHFVNIEYITPEPHLGLGEN